jgi:hypothetical protein
MNKEYTFPVNLTLKVKLASQLIEDHSAASPYIVGAEVARHISSYVQKNNIGYYPAVNYFHDLDIIEPELFAALKSISWLVTTMSMDIIHTGLRSYLRNINFDSNQMIATTLPPIRPGSENAIHMLALHYTPDQLRINLHGDLKQSEENKSAHILEETKEKIQQWLNDKFVHAEVCDIWYLDDFRNTTKRIK